jgi:hypothetical protein
VRALRDAGLPVRSYALLNVAVDKVFDLVLLAVGALIFLRRSDNRMALLTSVFLLAFGTVAVDPTDADALVSSQPAWWLPVRGVEIVGAVCVVLFFLLFPSGRFVPRWTRWIPILWAAHEVAYYFFPSSPLNIKRSSPLLDFVTISTFVCIAIGSQIYRYRRVSSPTQRQQTKWVVFGIVLGGLGTIGFALPFLIYPTLAQFGSPIAFALETGIYGSLLLIPLSIGVAILHDRLWDIDIVINRTLVYGSLTGMLALVYFGCIVLSQRLFVVLTGEKSTLAVVASTLVIASLFTPLRHRIQSFIDRRFYRRKYDARKTLDAFSTKIRDETNLAALSDDLVMVVRDTMQPAHVSLWLRPESKARRR